MFIGGPFIGKERQSLTDNIARIWKLPPGSHFSNLFASQVLRHQVTSMLESWRIILNPDLLHLQGMDELTGLVSKAEALGRGHLIITSHLGSWELVALAGATASSKPFHVLAKAPKVKGIKFFLTWLRQKMGVQVLWTDRRSLLKDMLRNLRSGGSIGFVMDQKPEGRKGPRVKFFGIDTEFVSGPSAMMEKTGCAIIGVHCVRLGPYKYRIISEALHPGGELQVTKQELTQKLASYIESVIRLFPEQWCWNYRRWKFTGPISADSGAALPAKGLKG